MIISEMTHQKLKARLYVLDEYNNLARKNQWIEGDKEVDIDKKT